MAPQAYQSRLVSRRVLPPIKHKDAYTSTVYKEVDAWFYEAIFAPLFAQMALAGVNPNQQKKYQERQNSTTSAIEEAFKAKRIWYADGKFSGQFNAAVSRELRKLGATWNQDQKTFALVQWKIPLDLRNSIYKSMDEAKALHTEIVETIGQMQLNIATTKIGLNFTKQIDKITFDLQKQFVSTIDGIDSIEVPAEINPAMRKVITEEFTENLDLYIKKFALEKLPELRKQVEQNAFAGYRTDRLSRIIQTQYGVSQRKAEFLADQETSLLVSKYRQQRYQQIGSQRYKWSTSNDQRVRHDHKLLEGRTFFWSEPPVVDPATGRRANPGEDYRCRCVALPILDIEEDN